MAGVKGKSGGPRPNSGGRRPGAGRKPKPPAVLAAPAPAPDHEGQSQPGDAAAAQREPFEWLLMVMRGELDPNAGQLKAGIAAARIAAQVGPAKGKKEAKKEAAEKLVSAGRFGARRAPLKVVGGKQT